MFKNRAYIFYLLGSVISAIGNGMQFIAITWLILELTQSPTQVGITLAISFIPLMCLASFGGLIADQYDRRYLMILSNVFRFLAICIVPLVYWFSELNIFVIYIMQLFNAIGTSFFIPANAGFVREIVDDKNMYRANALTQVWIQVGKLSGAGLGGVFVALFGSINVVLINALTFLVAAFFIFYCRRGYTPPRVGNFKQRKFWGDLNAGFTLLIKQKSLLFYVFLSLLPAVFVHIYNLAVGVFVKQELNEGANALGFIDGGYALGAMVLGFLISRRSDWLKSKQLIPLVILVMAVPFILFGFSQTVPFATISVFLMGAAFQIGFTMFNTLIQITPPKAFVGRVTGFAKSVQSLCAFVSLLFLGAWLETHSVRVLLVSIFVLLIFTSLLIYITFMFSKKQYKTNEVLEKANET
ncbi:MFS transporter [Virgibacillus sp. DJP39]|uniref:MFS transporter n=1 Tax=Virgibacillus sp. DJP39 TaxID=3409790 RepID=UPI003BB641A1